MVMCIQRKIFVMDWKIPPSSLKQNAIPAPRGFAPRVWNLHFAFVIRVEFFNPSLKFSLDSLNSKSDLPLKYFNWVVSSIVLYGGVQKLRWKDEVGSLSFKCQRY